MFYNLINVQLLIFRCYFIARRRLIVLIYEKLNSPVHELNDCQQTKSQKQTCNASK